MVTECRHILVLSSKQQTMSAKNATVPCTAFQTFNGIGITLNSMTSSFKYVLFMISSFLINLLLLFRNSVLKDDKKVEVRWLELESDLYLKQWQRRYRQLEGIDGNMHKTWNKSLLEV